MGKETFQVWLADRSLEFVYDGRELSLDGRPVDASVRETAPGHYSLLVDGRSLCVTLEPASNGSLRLRTRVGPVVAEVLGDRERLLLRATSGRSAPARHEEVRAPMPGLIVTVSVGAGDEVRAGDPLLVLEAMKMENEIRAPHAGRIEAVHAKPGQAVGRNELLLVFAAQ